MIKTDELRGIIAAKEFSRAEVARRLGMAPKTFYEKMKKDVFGSDEMQAMVDLLEIENPGEIFLRKKYLDRKQWRTIWKE